MDRRPLIVAAAALTCLLAGVGAAALPAPDVAAGEPPVLVQTASVSRPVPVAQPAGTTTVQTSQAGRPYVLHVPDGLVGPAPVVVVLHAHSQGPSAIRKITRFERLADEQGFVVAFPTGAGASWNAGSCCFPSSVKTADDVAYLDEVVRSITSRLVVDMDRVSFAGYSNGGMMAMRYACQRSSVVSSVAVASAVLVAPCAPKSGVAVLDLHGELDSVVPLAGGRNERLFSTFPPVSASLEPFRAAGGDVVLQVVPGAGHNYMGKDRTGVDATRVLWDFLRDHPRLGGRD